MRCDRCGSIAVTTVYLVGSDGDRLNADEQSCRWCLDVDELNQIRTAEAMEEADRDPL